MLRRDIIKLLERLNEKEYTINITKGEEYAIENEDALNNFKQTAEMLGTTPLLICSVYMYKHFCAIMNHAKRGDVLSEPIEGRILDLRLYAAIYLALVQEEETCSSK